MLRPYEQANIEPLFMGIETSQFHSLSVIFSDGRSGRLHISGFYFKFLDEIIASQSGNASEKCFFFRARKAGEIRPPPGGVAPRKRVNLGSSALPKKVKHSML